MYVILVADAWSINRLLFPPVPAGVAGNGAAGDAFPARFEIPGSHHFVQQLHRPGAQRNHRLFQAVELQRQGGEGLPEVKTGDTQIIRYGELAEGGFLYQVA